MATPFLSDIDLNYNQAKRTRLDNQASAVASLTTAQSGYEIFRTDLGIVQVWNGTAYDQSTGGVVTILGTTATSTVGGVTAASTVAAAGRKDQSVTLSVSAATASVAGVMSASDFSKLAAATAVNTPSTLVFRDASGNFAAGTITGNLTGTASNATNLNNQAASFYLNRTNHTGFQLANTISDFDTQVRTSRLDQMAVPTASVAYNNQRITGLADPTSPQDAATKNYVDSTAQGLDIKASVRVATTANITLSGTQTIDGVNLVAGDRVLVKNQTTGSTNGIYVVAAGAWTRSADADTSAEVTPGMFTFVEEGTTNDNSGWVLATNASITLDTTALSFTQFSGAGSYTAGNGLALTGGTTFSVVGTAGRIVVTSGGVNIDTNYLGQNSITTLGTITTGVWNGTPIAIANGGTGSTTAAGARAALGTPTKVVGTITGNGSLTSFTFTHSLGTANHSLTMTDSTGLVTYTDFTLGATADTIVTAQPVANGTVYTLTAVG